VVRLDVIQTRLAWALSLSVLAMACTVQPKSQAECNRNPPPEELEKVSEVPYLLDPNPLRSGTTAVLSVRPGDDEGSGDAVSHGMSWSCWNGVRWIQTHQVIRDIGSQTEPNPAKPGAVTTVVGSWLPIKEGYEVTIAEVVAGTYRLSDRTREGVMGFVYVEVIEA
jgi:hypothetical protein